MIQTLEAEVDEQGTVRLTRPVNFARKHRVLVMVMPEQDIQDSGETDDTWHQPYIDQPYRHLPSLS
jgi:hypothetical protein